MDQLSCYYAWRHRKQVNIVINFLWRSSDRIAEFVARSPHNPEVSCSSVTHAICKKFFPLINGDIWLASEFHTCFFSSSLLISNWSKLNFSHIFHNNIYWFLTPHELDISTPQQETAMFKSFSAIRQRWKVEQLSTSWRRGEEFFCGNFMQSSKLLRMLITFSSGKCRSVWKIPPSGKRS